MCFRCRSKISSARESALRDRVSEHVRTPQERPHAAEHLRPVVLAQARDEHAPAHRGVAEQERVGTHERRLDARESAEEACPEQVLQEVCPIEVRAQAKVDLRSVRGAYDMTD